MANGKGILLLSLLLSLVAGAAFGYQTKRVFIVNWDGTPYHVCDHDTTPFLWDSLATTYGTWFSNVWAVDFPITGSGHQNIMSGNPCFWTNDSNQVHYYPSLGEIMLKELAVTDTLKAVSFSYSDLGQERLWGQSHHPDYPTYSTKIRYTGPERADSLWRYSVHPYLTANTPQYIYINFHDPDIMAHASGRQGLDSALYYRCDPLLKDSVMYFLRNTNPYKDSTALLMITDHGRHSWDNSSGYTAGADSGHTDACLGCRHIWACLWGPDFRAGYTDTLRHEQTDIAGILLHALGMKGPTLRSAPLDTLPFATYIEESSWSHSIGSGGTQRSLEEAVRQVDVARSDGVTHWIWSDEGERAIRYRNSAGDTITLTEAAIADTQWYRAPRIAAHGDTVLAVYSYFRNSPSQVERHSWYTYARLSTNGGTSWAAGSMIEDTSTICSDVDFGEHGDTVFAVVVLAGHLHNRATETAAYVWVKRTTDFSTWSSVFCGTPAGTNCVLGRGIELVSAGQNWVIMIPASIGSMGVGGQGPNTFRQIVELVECRSFDFGGSWEWNGYFLSDTPTPSAPTQYHNHLQPSFLLLR